MFSATAAAQQSQLSQMYSAFGSGLGPQAFGVAPGREMLVFYGSLDMAINAIHVGDQSAQRMQSGNVWTSKIGLYGQENLGDGWTSFFRLESGLYADTGAQQDSSSLFNRASYVGLQNPDFGTLSLGRQYSSLGAAALGADVYLGNAHESIYSYLLNTSGLGGKGNTDAAARLNKTVRYISPKIGNRVSFDASYSFKSDQSTGPAAHAKTVAVNYADSSTVVGVGFGQSWCDPATSGSCPSKDAGIAAVRTDITIVSATQDLGPLVGTAAYLRFAPRSAGAGVGNLYTLGVEKMAGQDLWRAAFAYRDTSAPGNYAYGATLGVDHFLSKRTALYARLGLLKNGPQSSLIYNYEASGGNPTMAAGQNARDLSLGMYHAF